MSRKTVFEVYCAVVCVFSAFAIVILGGKFALNTYYYFDPDSGLNPVYKKDYESPYPPVKLPPEFEIDQTDEEKSAEKEKIYLDHVSQMRWELSHLIKQRSIYIAFLILAFIGHFRYLRKSSGKNT